MHVTWKLKSFKELSVDELYEIVMLRQEVFIIEQACPYADCDGKDTMSQHLMGINDDSELVCYARILEPGLSYDEVSIGRVVSKPLYRKYGLGKMLMKEALRIIKEQYGETDIRIGAQSYLLKFYNDFGFQESEPYVEDGIPHHIMIRKKIAFTGQD